MGICDMCKHGIPIIPTAEHQHSPNPIDKEQLLLPIRLKMSQEAREVLNVLINSGYDLADFVFCEHSGTITSIIATVECGDFIFGKTKYS